MEYLADIFTLDMLSSTIRMAIPLILASVGGTICERSGIINLGLEGMMLAGSFAGVLGTFLTGNPWLGVLTAVLISGLLGLGHATLCIKYKTNQSVSGIGINVLVSGLTIVLTRVIWKSDGMSGQVQKLGNPISYTILTVLVVVVAWFVMYRTKVGLRLRAIGDHPQAVETVGIHVNKYRYVCVTICGMLCGLGGAYLSIVQSNLFVKEMVAGRGFMALAAMILGAWNPIGALAASLVFAFAQALRMNLQIQVPSQFMLMLPYALTLVVLMTFGRNAKGPQSAGKIEA